MSRKVTASRKFIRSLLGVLALVGLTACSGAPSAHVWIDASVAAPVVSVERADLAPPGMLVTRTGLADSVDSDLGPVYGEPFKIALSGKLCAVLCGTPGPVLDFNFLGGQSSATATTFTVPGTGQAITFSQTTPSTMFGATGLLTYAPNNVFTQSNTFSNAAWSKTTMTVTSGVADPFGGTTASTLTATGANALVSQGNPLNFVSTLFAIWVRARTVTGLIQLRDVAGVFHTISVTSSWQQFSFVAASSTFPELKIVNLGDAVDVYAATLSAVVAETTPRPQDQVITTASAYFGARFDYNPATLALNGLYDEPASTNEALQVRDMTNAAWTKGATITVAHTATGIDGASNTANLVTGGAVSATNTVLQALTITSEVQTYSVYIKPVTVTGAINISLNGGSTWTDISSQLVAGKFFRVNTEATLANPSIGVQIINSSDQIIVDANQVEDFAFPSSFIPTSAFQVTRAAEVISATVPASVTNNKIVSGAVKAMTAPGIGANIQIAQQVDSGSASNRVRVYRDTNRHMKVLFTSGGADQATLDLGSVSDSTAVTVAWRASNGSFGASLNGAAEVAASGTQPAGLTTVRGCDSSSANQWAGWEQKWALWAVNINTAQKATGSGW